MRTGLLERTELQSRAVTPLFPAGSEAEPVFINRQAAAVSPGKPELITPMPFESAGNRSPVLGKGTAACGKRQESPKREDGNFFHEGA